MTMLNAPLWWRNVITGAVILLAVLIDIERQRIRKPAPRPVVEASALNGNYLSEVLSRLSTAVKQHMGSPYSCVYLVERDAGDLVEQAYPWAGDQAGNGVDRIVSERAGIAPKRRKPASRLMCPTSGAAAIGSSGPCTRIYNRRWPCRCQLRAEWWR